MCTCSFLHYISSSCRDKKRTVSTVVAASSSSVVVKRRKKRYGSADDVPTVSVSEPNLLTTDSTKVTKSSSKHKATKQTNENSNNSNSIGHNLRRDMLSVSDTSLNKIPHKQVSSHAAKPSAPKSGSREDVKVTSPEQVIYTASLLLH